MSFLLVNFQLAMSFRYRLRVRHGRDGRTDEDYQRFMPQPYTGGA